MGAVGSAALLHGHMKQQQRVAVGERPISRALFFILLLILPTGCSKPATDQREFLLTGTSAGPVKIGQTKQEVWQLSQRYRLEEEGMPAPAIEVYDGEKLLLTAEFFNDKVHQITLTSPRFRTREGISVGSTFGDVKRYFGEPSFMGFDKGVLYALYDTASGVLGFALGIPEALEERVTQQTKVF